MKEVTAALLVHEKRLLIAQRPQTDKLAGLWEFPGGKVEPGETPEVCLKREMQEEFSIDILVGDFFGESVYSYPQGSIHLMAYWAEWTGGQFKLAAHDSMHWVQPHQLEEFKFAPADIPFAEQLSKMASF